MDYQNLLLVIVTLVLLVIFGNLLCKLMVLSLNFQLAFTPKLMGKQNVFTKPLNKFYAVC